jgi:hypothetical protein
MSLTNQELYHEDVWQSGCIHSSFLNLSTGWRWVQFHNLDASRTCKKVYLLCLILFAMLKTTRKRREIRQKKYIFKPTVCNDQSSPLRLVFRVMIM